MSGASDDMKKKKLLYIEFLRAAAIFFVIYNHTLADGFLLFTKYPTDSFQYWRYLAISIFCKFAVPVYFMISGALLLGKDEPLKVLWGKRILRMVIVLVVISLVYYLAELCMGRQMAFDVFLRRLYGTTVKTHLWFLYLYIAFLMALPFLRAMVRKLETKYFYYLIGLAVVFTILHFVAAGTSAPEVYSRLRPGWLFTIAVLYPCVGYFLEHRVDERFYSVKQLLVLWALNISATMMTCALMARTGDKDNYYDIFGLVNSICVFYSAKLLFLKWRPGKCAKWIIATLGSCAFGVYLTHVLLLTGQLKHMVLGNMVAIGVNRMVACLVWCAVLYLLCAAAIWLIKKIPLMRKFI